MSLITLTVRKSFQPPPLPERRLGQILIALSGVESGDKALRHSKRPEEGATCQFHGLADGVGVKLFRDAKSASWNADVQHRAWEKRLAPKVLSQPFKVSVSAHAGCTLLFGFLTERANVDGHRTRNAESAEDTTEDGRKYRKLIKAATAWCDGNFADLHSSNIGWIRNRPLVIDVDGFPGSPRVGGAELFLEPEQIKAKAAEDARRRAANVKAMEAQKALDLKAAAQAKAQVQRSSESGPAIRLNTHDAKLVADARLPAARHKCLCAWAIYKGHRSRLRRAVAQGSPMGRRASAARLWLEACRRGQINTKGELAK